jgi:hypothetical protein
MSSGDNVRDQFSALQKQQKDRLSQLQQSKTTGSSTKKKDVSDDENVFEFQRNFLLFSLGECFDEF